MEVGTRQARQELQLEPLHSRLSVKSASRDRWHAHLHPEQIPATIGVSSEAWHSIAVALLIDPFT